MALGRKTGGRKAGTLNKTTTTVRENTLAVFEMIGGRAHMAKWAKENASEFYRLYGRMAPSDPDSPGGANNPLLVRVERVIVDNASD